MCVYVLNENYCYVAIILIITIKYVYIHLSQVLLWNLFPYL